MAQKMELTPEKINQNTKEELLQEVQPESVETSENEQEAQPESTEVSENEQEVQPEAVETSENDKNEEVFSAAEANIGSSDRQNTAEEFARLQQGVREEFRYGMTNDYMFRGVLQESPKALRSLAAASLGVKESEITSCEIMNPIILGQNIDAKTSVLDIHALINKKKKMNLEMEMWGMQNWPKRSVFYLCRMFTSLGRGQDYNDALPCVHIGFVKKSPFGNPPTVEDAGQNVSNKFVTRYKLMDSESGHVYTEDFALALVDLSALDAEIGAAEKLGEQTGEGIRRLKETKKLRDWVRLICAENWEEAMDVAKDSEAMQDAVVTMHKLTAEEEFRLQCLARELYEGDMHGAEKQGEAIGQARGEAIGENRERENSRKREEAKSKRQARYLSELGLSLEKIAQAVETSADTVKLWLTGNPQATK